MRFDDVIDALGVEGARCVVIGGAARALYGDTHEPADLDLVVDTTPVEAQRVLNALGRCGFMPTIPLTFAEASIITLLDEAGRRIDCFGRFYIPFDELFARSVRLANVAVASPEDLSRIAFNRVAPKGSTGQA